MLSLTWVHVAGVTYLSTVVGQDHSSTAAPTGSLSELSGRAGPNAQTAEMVHAEVEMHLNILHLIFSLTRSYVSTGDMLDKSKSSILSKAQIEACLSVRRHRQ